MSSRDSEPLPRTDGATLLRLTAWSAVAVAVVAIIAAAKFASAIVAPTVLAGLLALALGPLVAGLERARLPSALSAAVVVGAVVSATAGLLYLLIPSFQEWRLRAPSAMRRLEWELRDIEREIEEATPGSSGTDEESGEEKSAADAVMESGQNLVTDMLLATPEVLIGFLYVTLLCFFLLAERVMLRRLALSLCPDWKTRLRLSRTFLDMRRSVGHYLLTVAVINTGLGAAAGVAFFLMGLPNPVLWGAMVTVLNFMPYVGPLLANVIVFAIGFLTFSSLLEALYPVVALVALNVVEGQIVTPMVVGQRSRVGALSVFLAVAFGAWLWGALGALVAAPLLIVLHRFWRRMVMSRPVRTAGGSTHPPEPAGSGPIARLSSSVKAAGAPRR